MITDLEGQKPSQQLVVLDKYFRKFLKWALKLSLDDKLTLAKFLLAVQSAHDTGQKAAPAEPVADDTLPSPILLPERSFIKHQPQKDTGASYGDLDSMLQGRKPDEPAN